MQKLKFKNQIKEIIKKADIFSQSVTFSFRQQEQYSTFFGGVVSILVLVTIISFFYSNIIDFFMMKNVSSTIEMIFENDPSKIELNANSFMFAVQIEHDYFVDSPYFNITVEQRHYMNKNGTMTKMPNQYIDLVICTDEHFKPIFDKYGVNYEKQFQDLNMTNFLCPNLNQTIIWTVGGAYTSEDYYFLKFSVTSCINDTTSNFTWKPNCKTNTEMLTQLASQGSFRFQLYTTNYIVNPDEPTQYITPYLAIEQFYSFVPQQMFVQSDIFVREKRINSDKGILMYPVDESETIAYREHMDSRQQFEIGGLYENYFAAFYLQRSPFSYNIQRSFVTLDELLSQLGGFSQFMVVILGIFVNIYNKQSLLLELANDLYEFNIKQRKENTQAFICNLLSQSVHGKEKHQKREPLKIQSLNPFMQKPVMDQRMSIISPQQSKLLQATTNLQIQTKGSKASEYFNKFKNFMINQKKLTLGYRIILGDWLPFDCLQDQDYVLFQRAMSQVNKELDIRYIMNQLHEIIKIKKVLFDKNQLDLFNFSRKPQISLVQEARNRLSSKFFFLGEEEQINTELAKQYYQIVAAYQKTQETICENEMNQRIIGLLGREVSEWIEQELQVDIEPSESLKEPIASDDEISKQ